MPQSCAVRSNTGANMLTGSLSCLCGWSHNTKLILYAGPTTDCKHASAPDGNQECRVPLQYRRVMKCRRERPCMLQHLTANPQRQQQTMRHCRSQASFILAHSMHMLWLASCVCRQGTNTPACARLKPGQPTPHQSAQGVVSYQDGILDAPSGPMQQTQVTPSNCQRGRLHPNPSIVLPTRMHA